MKIKAVDIFGFKSFFDKTTLNFLPGITAMVGPNGCGKSNIVDAIRWSLGEQSAKHLRGNSMEDVIFNGSRSKKPLGMAEVTLTFANDNGHAPIQYLDYPEIQITRRVFRSGESEYFINKVPCRLRDITELFLDTGVGSRAYSIIEQGRVETIINAKPTDIRILIEEAAGISKYKARKQEALRKMDATRQNLVRVNDLLGEIQKQINSLKYQAQKLKRFKGLKDRIRTLDLAVASQQHRRLGESRSQKAAELQNIKERQTQLQTEIESVASENVTRKTQLHEEEEKLASIQGKKYEVEYAIRETESTIEVAQEKIEDLKRLTAQAEHETEENHTRLQQEQQEVARATAMKSDLEWQISQREVQIRREEEHVQALKQAYASVRAELEQQREELFELRNELSRREHMLDRAQQTRTECEQRLHQNRLESGDAEGALEDLRRSHSLIQEELTKGQQDLQALEEEEQAHRHTISGLEHELKITTETIAELKEKQARCESLLQSLQELRKNFEGCSDGVRSIMQRSEAAGHPNHGIFGLLADFIDTEPRYESAVEAALGEKLQYVVVKSQAEGVEAIDYLKAQSLGRVSFVPKEEVRCVEGTPHGNSHSQATSLTSVVRAKEGYEPFVRYLLGNTLVVEDLAQGLELWRTNNVNGSALVTLEGDIIDPTGIITGGVQNGTGSSFLRKKREIAELEENCLTLREALRSAQADQETVRQSLESHRLLIKVVQDRLVQQKLTSQNKERDLHQNTDEIQRTEKKLAFLHAEEQKLRGELQEIEANLKKHHDDQEQLKARYASQQEAFSELQQKEASGRESIEHEERTFNQSKIDLMNMKAHLSNVTSTLELRAQTIEKCRTEIDKYKQARERATAEQLELRQKIASSKQHLDDLTATFQQHRGELQKQEECVNEHRLALQKEEERSKEIQRAFNNLQPTIQNLEREHTDLKSQVRYIEEKIASKYHVLLNEVANDFSAEDYPEEETQTKLERLVSAQERMIEGINFNAEREYEEQAEKLEFYQKQSEDLNSSLISLQEAINRINRTSRQRFREAYGKIRENFRQILPLVFEGGTGELSLTDDHDLLETGVEIKVQPVGKSLKSITLLSGGEKALSAISLLFALYLYKPSPFCLLDEVDSPLDDANVYRFTNILRRFAKDSQFLIITHNKHTMETADILYGITMEEPGISKVVSVELNEPETS